MELGFYVQEREVDLKDGELCRAEFEFLDPFMNTYGEERPAVREMKISRLVGDIEDEVYRVEPLCEGGYPSTRFADVRIDSGEVGELSSEGLLRKAVDRFLVENPGYEV